MLTVLLATRNRASLLRQVLNRYCLLLQPHGGWELILVDNGSSDETKDVVSSFAQHLPARYTLEPREGKNIALRTGFEDSEGSLVLFTDDDILPCNDWLVQFQRTADERPEFTMFGGPITPRWPRPPSPLHIADDSVAEGCFGGRGTSFATGPIKKPLPGGNFAVRRRALGSEDFNPGIGPDGRCGYAMGSETDLQIRVEGRGGRSWWIASAVVEHMIRPEQMERDWMLQRAVNLGRGLSRLINLRGASPVCFGAPRWVVRRLLGNVRRFLWACLTGRKDAAFLARWHATRDWALVRESRTLRGLEGKAARAASRQGMG